MNTKCERNLKIVVIVAFIFIALALIQIARNSPATGYELSIYSALPVSTWVFLITALVAGIFIIVHQAFTENEGSESNLWMLGFFILIMINFIILSLHIFRGYYLYAKGDPLGHLGHTNFIVSNGFLSETNFVPVTHILGAILIEICSIQTLEVMKYLPVIFTILSMIFVYFLATAVTFKRGQALLAAVTGSTLLYSYYHVTTYPQALSLLTFPLVFYLYFKASEAPSMAYKTMFVILLLLFPFFHPAPEVVLIFCMVGGELAKAFMNFRWKRREPNYGMYPQGKISANPALISFTIFFMWFSSFTIFSYGARKFQEWFSEEVTEIVPRVEEVELVMEMELWERIQLIFKMYGDQFIYLFLALIAVAIIFRYISRRREYKNLFILAILFLISGPVYILIFMGGLTTVGRLAGANTVIWVTPVLSAFVLYKLFKRPKISKTVGIAAVIFILVFSSTLSIFTVYHSPLILQPNWQVTQMDMRGSGWVGSNVKVPRHELAPMGWLGGYHWVKIPDHFGYREHERLGDSISRDTYIMLTKRFKLAALDPTLATKGMMISGDLARPGFDECDFERLEKDASVDRLYTNGEFEVLLAARR